MANSLQTLFLRRPQLQQNIPRKARHVSYLNEVEIPWYLECVLMISLSCMANVVGEYILTRRLVKSSRQQTLIK